MTQISNDDVQALAQLSGLQLKDGEAASLQQDITAILGYIEELNELDTNAVEPRYQVTDLSNVWRSDEVEQPLSSEDLLALAPEQANQQIKVPKVL